MTQIVEEQQQIDEAIRRSLEETKPAAGLLILFMNDDQTNQPTIHIIIYIVLYVEEKEEKSSSKKRKNDDDDEKKNKKSKLHRSARRAFFLERIHQIVFSPLLRRFSVRFHDLVNDHHHHDDSDDDDDDDPQFDAGEEATPYFEQLERWTCTVHNEPMTQAWLENVTLHGQVPQPPPPTNAKVDGAAETNRCNWWLAWSSLLGFYIQRKANVEVQVLMQSALFQWHWWADKNTWSDPPTTKELEKLFGVVLSWVEDKETKEKIQKVWIPYMHSGGQWIRLHPYEGEITRECRFQDLWKS
ncbi:MAG: hypothetical protein WC776_05080 [Patescibacteria group bacterium]|jgi:hypothetical protein